MKDLYNLVIAANKGQGIEFTELSILFGEQKNT